MFHMLPNCICRVDAFAIFETLMYMMLDSDTAVRASSIDQEV